MKAAKVRKPQKVAPPAARPPAEVIKNIESFVRIATGDLWKLSGSLSNATSNATTRERYVELVGQIAATDYPYLRERLNYCFRVIREDAARVARPKRRAPARRKVSA